MFPRLFLADTNPPIARQPRVIKGSGQQCRGQPPLSPGEPMEGKIRHSSPLLCHTFLETRTITSAGVAVHVLSAAPLLHLDVDAPGSSARRARCVIHFLVSRCCQRFGERDSNDRGSFLPCNFFTNPLRSKHSAGSECRLRWSCNRRGAFDGPTIFHSCSR